MEAQSSGEAVSCAPRQRALGPSREVARPPRASPGWPEPQLEPPGSLARQRDPRLSSKQSPVKTLVTMDQLIPSAKHAGVS
jgi:hypothetical protein